MIAAAALLHIAAGAAQAADPAPLPAEVHNFANWVVACDNGLRCKAVSLVPEPAVLEEKEDPRDPWDRFGVMRLEREAGPGSALEITVTDFTGVPARLLQHSQPVPARFAPAEAGVWQVIPDDLEDFVARLHSGTMSVQDAAGATLAEFALGGSQGAMLYMDERQGRLRTPTALVRRGSRPAAQVPPPVPLPVVRLAPATSEQPITLSTSELAAARRKTRCDEEQGSGPRHEDYHALGGGRTLVLISCGAGAYNLNSLPLIAWREGATLRVEEAPVDIRLEPFDGHPARFIVINASYDPAARRLSGFAKGRGLGDCGTYSAYGWDGARFRLVRQDEMPECRGTPELVTTWLAEER